MKYRVWVITNPPSSMRMYKVDSPEEAERMINAIANEHLFDYEITTNGFGLQIFQDDEWVEWEDKDGYTIRDAFTE